MRTIFLAAASVLEEDEEESPTSNGLVGTNTFESFDRYITRINKLLEWVTKGLIQQLCISMKPKPKLLKFWVKGYVSRQYLWATRPYPKNYAVDLQVTNDVLAKIHEFMMSGPHKEKTHTYQSPLKIKADFSDVKNETDDMGPADLPGVDLPLAKTSDFPLIFDGSGLTKNSDHPPGGLPLSHLEEQSFVAVELSMLAYQVRENAGYKLCFTKLFTLGNEAMWKAEVEEKGCGPIAAPSSRKRSKKFYSEEDDY